MDFSFPIRIGRFIPRTILSLDVSVYGQLRYNMDTVVFVSVIRRTYEVNFKMKYI